MVTVEEFLTGAIPVGLGVDKDESLAKGVNVLNGKVVYKDVAVAFGLEYVPMAEAAK